MSQEKATKEVTEIIVPLLVAERIISTVKPSECSWCAPEYEEVGEHEEAHIHKTLCPIGELEKLYNQQKHGVKHG